MRDRPSPLPGRVVRIDADVPKPPDRPPCCVKGCEDLTDRLIASPSDFALWKERKIGRQELEARSFLACNEHTDQIDLALEAGLVTWDSQKKELVLPV